MKTKCLQHYFFGRYTFLGSDFQDVNASYQSGGIYSDFFIVFAGHCGNQFSRRVKNIYRRDVVCGIRDENIHFLFYDADAASRFIGGIKRIKE